MIGLDRSIFDLYSSDHNVDIDVVTYRTSKPLFLLQGVDVSNHLWFHTIQGVSPVVAEDIKAYIGSYEFNDTKGTKPIQWWVTPTDTRVPDPFATELTGVSVTALLPSCSLNRRVVVANPFDIRLATPVLKVSPV